MIAVDATSQGALVNPGLSSTWSHTCTGVNRILFVGLFGDNQATDATGNLITGVTYNGVAMTEVGRNYAVSDRWTYLFSLVAPATGANNVVISASSSIAIQGAAASYTGAAQSGQPDTSTNQRLSSIASGANYTTTLTTVANNDWTVLSAKASSGTVSAGTGSTIRQSGNGNILADSNNAITPAGSTSMSLTANATANWGSVMAAFSPAGGVAVTPVSPGVFW